VSRSSRALNKRRRIRLHPSAITYSRHHAPVTPADPDQLNSSLPISNILADALLDQRFQLPGARLQPRQAKRPTLNPKRRQHHQRSAGIPENQ